MNACQRCGSRSLVSVCSQIDGVWTRRLVCKDCDHVLHREVWTEPPSPQDRRVPPSLRGLRTLVRSLVPPRSSVARSAVLSCPSVIWSAVSNAVNDECGPP